MTNETILVTGATGKTGRRVAALLRDRGRDVREASRSTDVPFNWADDTTWPAALDGVAAIYVVTTSLHAPETVRQFRSFAQLAVSSGASRVVVVSVPDDGTEGYALARKAEREFTDAGLELTVLRLRWFNQNFSEDFLHPAVIAGDLRLPAAEGAEAFIDASDIAEVAVIALTEDGHGGRDYNLTGPRLLTFTEIAEELTTAIGREITYTAVSRDQYIAEQTEQGVPEEWATLSADLYASIASGALEATSSDVSDVLGRPASDFRDFARDASDHGAWDIESTHRN